jgi:nicotinamide-nucleotide amidase
MNLALLARKTGTALKRKGQMLVTAESCTGGWVAQAVTSVAGSSDWFERGYVTYSNAAKREELGVGRTTLVRHGAVSEQAAREMARGALKRSRGALGHGRGTIALAVTGVAGPSGGSPDKPVGTVCFGWAQGRRIRSETKRFKGGRASVRRQSVIHALRGLSRWL